MKVSEFTRKNGTHVKMTHVLVLQFKPVFAGSSENGTSDDWLCGQTKHQNSTASRHTN